MPFRQDCLAILPHLPEEFTEADLNRWVPWLHRRHRNVTNPYRHLLDALRGLEAEGLVRSIGSNTWRKTGGHEPGTPLDLGLVKNDDIDREELARILGMRGSAALQRGMFKRAGGPFEDHLLLFHDPEENPYGDVVRPGLIHYVGQGQEGNQKLESYNRYLAEHLKRGLKVHFFEKEGPGEFRYEGEVICEDVERVYRPEEGRSVLRFELVPVDPIFVEESGTPIAYYQAAQQEIVRFRGKPRFVERRRETSVARRLVRDLAFRDVLMGAYEHQCAVCGAPLVRDDLTELEAAHIVGVAEQGPDDPRNGLCLCVRHHWAFDNGVFTLTDEFEVQTFLDGPDPHGELNDGHEILLPDTARFEPHPWYIRYHRDKWNRALS